MTGRASSPSNNFDGSHLEQAEEERGYMWKTAIKTVLLVVVVD